MIGTASIEESDIITCAIVVFKRKPSGSPALSLMENGENLVAVQVGVDLPVKDLDRQDNHVIGLTFSPAIVPLLWHLRSDGVRARV